MAERKPKSPPRKKSPKKAETAPIETAPVETTAVETAPVDTAPVDTAPVDTAPALLVDRDAIAARAYEIWRERGGRAFDNWLEAERQLGA